MIRPPEYDRLLKSYGRRTAEAYLKVVSNPGYLTRSDDQHKCRHQWAPFYEQPTDADFLNLFEDKRLNRFYQCKVCHCVGRSKPEGRIQRLRNELRAIADREQWYRNLRTYNQSKREGM